MKNFMVKYKYYSLLLFFYFFIAFINLFYIYKFNLGSYFNFKMLYFFFFWTVLFIFIRLLLPKRLGKILTLAFQIFLILITVANYFFLGYFNSAFSWKDILLSGEGFAFISSIFPMIGIKIILVFLFLILLIILSVLWSPKEKVNLFLLKKILYTLYYH